MLTQTAPNRVNKYTTALRERTLKSQIIPFVHATHILYFIIVMCTSLNTLRDLKL